MKGFTLIELIVVLFILGLVAGAVAPAFLAGQRQGQETEAADRVEALLRRARKLSLERGAAVSLSLNVSSGAYIIRLENAGTKLVEESGTLSLPAGATLSAPQQIVEGRFWPDGSADLPTLTAIQNGRARVISTDRWSGRIGATR
jgi:type II secretion system protein H